MTNDEFRAWLLGYVMLTQDLVLTLERIQIIKNHAALAKEVDGFLTVENQMAVDNLVVGQGLAHLLL